MTPKFIENCLHIIQGVHSGTLFTRGPKGHCALYDSRLYMSTNSFESMPCTMTMFSALF